MEPIENNIAEETVIPTSPQYQVPKQEKPQERYWLHLGLFLLTFLSTIWAGAELATNHALLAGDVKNWSYWIGSGLMYAIPFLLFLTFHEFGHYFAARHHGISATLPYYIPAPLGLLGLFNIGTFGAVIKIREPLPSTIKLFDVGLAGPLAGFVVSLGVLCWGFFTLPGPEYLLQLPAHEALQEFIRVNGRFPTNNELAIPAGTLFVGKTPLYWLMSQFFDNVPPMYEMYHYPVLFAGWLGLFFTALNLLPVGQLDGGHIWYALVGQKWHGRLARCFVMLLMLSAGMGFMVEVAPLMYAQGTLWAIGSWILLATIFYYFLHKIFKGNLALIAPSLLGLVILVSLSLYIGESVTQFGYSGWFFWCILLILFIRVDHPPVLKEEPLTSGRKFLAYLSIVIFILCFSITPLYIT